MKTKIIGKLYIAGIIAIIISACSENSQSPVTTKPDSGTEPNGGNWQTVVIPSGDIIILDAPKPANSLDYQKEMEEVKQMQSKMTPDMKAAIDYWNGKGVIRWNEIARSLVIKYNTNPPLASRVYALLSVGQYDALVSAWKNKYRYNRMSPADNNPEIKALVDEVKGPSYPSEHAVIASVSKEILEYLYPAEAGFLAAKMNEHQESRIWACVNVRSDIDAANILGKKVADAIIERAKTDNSDLQWTGTVPVGEGLWFSSLVPPMSPLLPRWSEVKTWLINSLDGNVCPPPPVYKSEAFMKDLNEVKQISMTRTPDQQRIAEFWADGGGTYTPPGHWNAIAEDIIIAHHMNELRTARVLALMNMAIMDAGICCWAAKYQYWLIRPSQADTTITLAVPLPNFPSYSSGHSTFSAAAATLLGYIFPDKAEDVNNMAQEAAISRVYAGIHYRFDSEEGFKNGVKIGNYAIERAKSDRSDK